MVIPACHDTSKPQRDGVIYVMKRGRLQPMTHVQHVVFGVFGVAVEVCRNIFEHLENVFVLCTRYTVLCLLCAVCDFVLWVYGVRCFASGALKPRRVSLATSALKHRKQF